MGPTGATLLASCPYSAVELAWMLAVHRKAKSLPVVKRQDFACREWRQWKRTKLLKEIASLFLEAARETAQYKDEPAQHLEEIRLSLLFDYRDATSPRLGRNANVGLINSLPTRKPKLNGRPRIASKERDEKWINYARGMALGYWIKNDPRVFFDLQNTVSFEAALNELRLKSTNNEVMQLALKKYIPNAVLTMRDHELSPVLPRKAHVERARIAHRDLPLPEVFLKKSR